MTIACYPVILCGGAGVRLWPASRADRPKPFIPLLGGQSLFQATVSRVGAIAGAQAPIIVAGLAHEELISTQLAALGVDATVLLEPEARDSAAAIAAACAWIEARDPGAVAVVVASDHHIDDAAAFCAAIDEAAAAARARDVIVTLGMTPTSPNTSYGYIAPVEASSGVRSVTAFVEKPDAARATEYIAKGYLWNSGNFVARAATMIGELERHAAEVAAAARGALATAASDGAVLRLGSAFADAPKVSIDYAVMEKTDRAAVLPVNFVWSDLGAWNAVLSAIARDADGNAVSGEVSLRSSRGVLARAGDGMRIVAIGVRDIAIIVEDGQVLVCALDASQQVKSVIDALKAEGGDAL